MSCAAGLMCRTGYCSLRDLELEEASVRQTCVSCVAHCFDLSCRLQDLKCAASNRMLQMVKVLPRESNTLLETDVLLLKTVLVAGFLFCLQKKVIYNNLRQKPQGREHILSPFMESFQTVLDQEYVAFLMLTAMKITSSA